MDLDNLLLQALEIEGAIRVARGNDSAEARQLLAGKVRQFVESYKQLGEPEQEPVAAPAPVAGVKPEVEVKPAPVVEVKPAPVEEVEVEAEADDPIVIDEPVEAPAAEPEPEPEPEPAAKPHGLADKAFTLNDRYRFTAELFNGDSEDFAETVKLLATMPGMEEVKDYLYNDLMWEPDSEMVQEFLDTVERNMR